ncbi:MAG: DNA-directed RNA polymerase subunit alpha [Candidatus Pacebacteria bacterium]|nr:DNA-directed RNA polymerase subunit alpha [Candidatus Paceibacterota bacterium]
MIPLPLKPKITKQINNTAFFEIEGLYPGYGVTISNTLRRVLLSSLEGAAITQVKIKGAPHEFSTIPGVLEDVVMIILNLKKLNFKNFSDEPQTISLKIKGEKDISAKDFKLTSQLKLANPDIHIATLTKSTAELDIEAVVEKGIGYLPIEKKEGAKAEVGVFPMDAIFTPVRKVNAVVENMRVGKRTDFDKIILEVETNGVISPQEAFKKASDILVSHFSLLADAFAEQEVLKEDAKEDKSEEKKKIKIDDLNLTDRIKTALADNGVKTVAGLVKKTEENLKEFNGLGDKAIEDIKKSLKKIGLALKT